MLKHRQTLAKGFLVTGVVIMQRTLVLLSCMCRFLVPSYVSHSLAVEPSPIPSIAPCIPKSFGTESYVIYAMLVAFDFCMFL